MTGRRGARREFVYRLADGRDIGVAEYGDPDGQPMVLFHGAPGSRLMFEPADEVASKLGLRLICPDRPGIGLSSPHPGRTLDTFSDDIAEVIDKLKIDRFALFGVSGGAPYATVAAARWGDRLRMLALVSPMGPVADSAGRVAIPAGQHLFFLRLGQGHILAPAIAGAAARLFRFAPLLFHRMFAAMLGEPDRTTLLRDHIPRHVVDDVAECLRQGTGGALGDLRLYGRSWCIDWRLVTAPVLMWQGTADRIVPVVAVLELARVLPTVDLALIEGAGHFWIYDNIPAVLGAIAAKLSDVDVAP